MAHIGEEVALRAVGELGRLPGLSHLFLGGLALGNVGIDRDNGAIGHRTAADVHDTAARAGPVALARDVAIESLDPLVDVVLRIDGPEIAAPCLQQQDVPQQHPAGRRRKIEQFEKPRVPRDQPAMPIEHAEPLAHVFEGALQQRPLFAKLVLALAPRIERAVLAIEGPRQQPGQTAGSQHQHPDANQQRYPDCRGHVVEDSIRTAPDRGQRNCRIAEHEQHEQHGRRVLQPR